METNKKFIISLTSVAVVAVAAIVSLVVVLAAFTVTTTNEFTIRYSAAGVEATVSGQYKTSTTEYQTMSPASITFERQATGADITKSFEALNNLTLNKGETFVMKYTIANNSDTVGIDINFTMTEPPSNMSCKYVFSTTDTEPTWAGIEDGTAASIADAAIDAGKTNKGYIWVLFQVVDINQDVTFAGNVTCQLTAVNPVNPAP